MQITKKDYLIVGIIGILFGLLLIPVLKNIQLSFFQVNLVNSILLVIVFAIFAVVALWVSSLLAKIIPVFLQVAKFAAVGGLNTLLNLGVLNLLIYIFSIAKGLPYSIFIAIAFIIANFNSYFWNKYWTFGSKEEAGVKEFGQFFVVSLVGFGINVGVASLIVNVIGSVGGISDARWANVGALSATVVSLVWNFVGYKFIVFKKKDQIASQPSLN